jgi:epoxide hydrolase 4
MLGLAPEFQFIETNGIRLHCAIAGSENTGHGTIVLLHGFPDFWYSWRHQIIELSRLYRVVAPDLRGFNLSDKPTGVEQYQVKQIVADVAGLIAALGNKPVTLVGHDWGGAVAWPVSAFHPQLVSRLIILNGPHPSTYTREIIFNPQQRLAAQYIHSFRRQGAVEHLSQDKY